MLSLKSSWSSPAVKWRNLRRPFSPLDQITLSSLRLDRLRQAVRRNYVSFPSQVPTFEKHDRSDLQRKLVQLYFLFGWSCDSIGDRYGLKRQRVNQVLTSWKLRATQMGYIQYIPPPENLIAAAPPPSFVLAASDSLRSLSEGARWSSQPEA